MQFFITALILGAIWSAGLLLPLWKIVRAGVPVGLDKAAASRIYQRILGIMIAAVVALVLGAVIGVTFGNLGFPEIGRAFIFANFMFAALVFIAGAMSADMIAKIAATIKGISAIERIRRIGVEFKGILLTFAGWALFIGLILLMLGVHAPWWAFALGIFGGVACGVVAAIYPPSDPVLPKLAYPVAAIAIGWAILVAVPPSFWVGTVGTDLSITFAGQNGMDNFVVRRVNQMGIERKTELCTKELKALGTQLAAARIPAEWDLISAEIARQKEWCA